MSRKDITGYEVAEDGRVFSIASNWRGYGRRELSQSLNSYGYPSVRLTINGSRKRYAVHVLVAEQYLGPRPSPDHEVRHLDGGKMNSSADNLAWGTRKENSEDRERHGRTSRGLAHSESIKSSNHADRVRESHRHRAMKKNSLAKARGE